MSTGPYGQQGLQGAYGPRGITGAFGWGYGTNLGPTGSIGCIKIIPVTSGNIAIATSNVSSVFRVQIPYNFTCDLPSGLTSANVGQFWTFSNDTASYLPVTMNITGNSFGKVINSGASLTLVYNGGTSTNISNYFVL
jgi:hypothetical protein